MLAGNQTRLVVAGPAGEGRAGLDLRQSLLGVGG
jgi:hypothetical protein